MPIIRDITGAGLSRLFAGAGRNPICHEPPELFIAIIQLFFPCCLLPVNSSRKQLLIVHIHVPYSLAVIADGAVG